MTGLCNWFGIEVLDIFHDLIHLRQFWSKKIFQRFLRIWYWKSNATVYQNDEWSINDDNFQMKTRVNNKKKILIMYGTNS